MPLHTPVLRQPCFSMPQQLKTPLSCALNHLGCALKQLQMSLKLPECVSHWREETACQSLAILHIGPLLATLHQDYEKQFCSLQSDHLT